MIGKLRSENNTLKRQLNLIGDFHVLYENYEQAIKECRNPTGYDDEFLSSYITEKSSIFFKKYIRDSTYIADYLQHSMLATLLVANAVANPKVLDFGGGCALPVAFLNTLTNNSFACEWATVEVSSLVNATKILSIENVKFFSNISSAVSHLGRVDMVHTSGTLQCLKDPRQYLGELLDINARFIFFGRSAFNLGSEDIIGIQTSKISDHGIQIPDYPHPDGFVEYPFVYMPKSEFDNILSSAKYRLVANFDSLSGMRPINESRIIGGCYFYEKKP